MFDKYKISVDGNNLLAYEEDKIPFSYFLVKLVSYYEGKNIKIKKVRYYDDADLHEFLHGYDLDGEDYVFMKENLQVFAQPYFEDFLNNFSMKFKDTVNVFVDYLPYSETSDFIVAIQDYERSKEGD